MIFALLSRVGIPVDGQVVFVKGFFVVVEQLGYPRLFEVDGVGEDEVGEFLWFRTGEAD